MFWKSVASAALLQFAVEAVHVGMQLVDVRVLAANFADLAAHRNGHSWRLDLADERGEVRRQGDVDLLLLGQRRLRQIDERRGIDVDVVEPGGDFLLDQRAQRLQFLVAIRAVELLGVRLHVIALDEDRTAEPFAQRGGHHDRRVLVGTLLGVADFRAGDLEDEGAGVEALRRSDHRARRVIGHRPHVDRRDGEPAGFAAANRHVEVVDAGRTPAAAASERMIQRAVPFSSASPPNAAVQASLSITSPPMARGSVTLTRSVSTVAAGLTASNSSLSD
jgi:hypothetical protein